MSRELWGAVTGGSDGNWYDCVAFACELSRQTGRAYRTCDYLYALSSNGGTFYHNSYQGHERADFRMFEIYSNTSGDFPPTCVNNSCNDEIAKGQAASFYATQEVGQSTFVPARCPDGGCQ
ncbi:MAG: hypothetical protein JW751_17980 [Polyangiaceae bacterium]|nr:hypothetical protein [Polyangiaceae bacterium]